MDLANVPVVTKVSSEGKVSLPAHLRRAAGIVPGEPVVVRTVGREIWVQSVRNQLAELQERTKARFAGTGESVERFLTDKYAEAAREIDDA